MPRKKPAAGHRGWAGLTALACAALLSAAATLHPDARGLGTHQQLGLAPCSMVTLTGYPCPTCGMTTAFALTTRARFREALTAQPAGFTLALLTVAALAASLYTVATGHRPGAAVRRPTPFVLGCSAFALLILGWGFKLIWGLATGVLPIR